MQIRNGAMSMTIELILEIQALCAWHGAIVRYYLDPKNQEHLRAGTYPCEYVKIHTWCRDELRCIIHDIGVDCHRGQIDPAHPLKRHLDTVRIGSGFHEPPQGYGPLLEKYQIILSMRRLPPLIEAKLLEQVCRLQCFMDELGISRNSVSKAIPKPEKEVASRRLKMEQIPF